MQGTVSRFMRKTLMADEKVMAEARFHGFYTFWAFGAFSIWVLIGAGAQYLARTYANESSFWPLYGCLAIGGWMLFWMMLKKWTTEIIITNKRVLYKRGFFLIHIDEVDIEQLASDYVEQSLLGRLLDFGALHIRCIEANDIWLPAIANPYAFRNKLEDVKHRYRQTFMDVGRLYRHGSKPNEVSG